MEFPASVVVSLVCCVICRHCEIWSIGLHNHFNTWYTNSIHICFHIGASIVNSKFFSVLSKKKVLLVRYAAFLPQVCKQNLQNFSKFELLSDILNKNLFRQASYPFCKSDPHQAIIE